VVAAWGFVEGLGTGVCVFFLFLEVLVFFFGGGGVGEVGGKRLRVRFLWGSV